MTVLSPLEYTGGLAMLIGGFTSAVTPLTVQYSGRHIFHSNVKLLETELAAPGTIGRIQFGAARGLAQVIVPRPRADGAAQRRSRRSRPAPWEPGGSRMRHLLLLQAARAVTLATATSKPAGTSYSGISSSALPLCAADAYGPSWGHELVALLSRSSPVIRSGTVAGLWVAVPLPVTARSPGTSAPAHGGPTGQLPVS